MRYLGQHFLIQKNIVKKIANLAGLSKSDTVLEVGPGKGILTEELLMRAGKVVAVEKDRNFCEFLRDKFSEEIRKGKLVLAEGDVLKIFNFKFLISNKILNHNPEYLGQITNKLEIQNSKLETKLKFQKYKIVANIPYYITSRFLKIFLEEAEAQPEKMVLMVQKEVAERICETPLKSILAVSVQVYGEPKLAFKVSAGNFSPSPKVDSAVLIIDNISKKWFNGIKEDEFFAGVKAGFSKKRKMLLSNLSEGLKITKPEMEEIFKKCGIGLKVRAEELELTEWKCLTKNLKCKN